MIAALPMYDAPGQRPVNDRLWAEMRKHLPFETPEHLTRDVDLWDIWRSPDLLFAQTCGLPYRARLHDTVTLIGAPDHRLPGVPAGQYQSVIVMRAGDPIDEVTGLRLAINDPLSQSGWAVVAGEAMTPTELSGSHAASARAVLDGKADVAAIDASTWRHLCSVDEALEDLTVIRKTPPGPTLPFITAKPEQARALYSALELAFTTLSDSDKSTLGMYGIVPAQPGDYLRLPIPEAPVFG